MGKGIRLDKMLAHMGYGSRKEIRRLCKEGLVTIDEKVVKDSSLHVDTENQRVKVGLEVVEYREYVYLLLNKPAGVISATEDLRHETVIDLIDEGYRGFDLFPVGRLDIDTEGLLLLTNDGQLAHKLLSPKKHVPKTYYAEIEGIVTEEDKVAFKAGVTLDDGYKTLPADLKILKSDIISEIELTIYEGKFHQVKRMFEVVNKKVVYLRRISMGDLFIDEKLNLGEYRELTPVELALLNK
ncbi:pseudouridine synthase [Alkaliphilus peptidifermentans]|uniref:Pseudouridine synthase n=1 Tax=Alkaliphilus peptidifermentans DSM 18978 TaxID=1120976 RepID=A0A1G5EJB7_9FIRM|nr:pseudouridine synthase [Alkaliphilus peptidifermentans]SCY26881.1 ribosomal small subunit pseudouridine synthase A [Alkaliphilus peptidifermentans DSM 18978]